MELQLLKSERPGRILQHNGRGEGKHDFLHVGP